MLSERPHILPVLLPEEVVFQEAFSEGSEFQTEFTLENKTRSDITITKILSSCGCMGLSAKDGQSIEVPLVLSPSKSFSFQVVVATQNKTGKNVASIMVQYEYKGKPFMLVGKILFDVIPAPNDDDREGIGACGVLFFCYNRHCRLSPFCVTNQIHPFFIGDSHVHSSFFRRSAFSGHRCRVHSYHEGTALRAG